MSIIRTRWAAIGAAVAVMLGSGGIGIVSATQPDAAVAFVPIAPCRVLDTRAEFNVGPRSSPLGPGETYTVNTTSSDTGNCTDIPATATSVSMNITALDATLPTFLTVWSTGAAQPAVSSLNPVPGSPPTPNAVTTSINVNGQFDIFNLQGNVHVIADVNGYYTDHDHDDRYYTQAQVDSAIVDAIDALPGTTTVPTDTAALESRISALEAALAEVSDASGNWVFPGDVAIAGSLSVDKSISAGGGALLGKSLAVAGELSVGGGTSIGGPLAADGDAALGRSLSVGNSLSVGGELAVDGGAAIGSNLSVEDNFAVGRDAALGRSLQIGNDLTVGGPIAASGDVITNGDFIDNSP